MDRFIDEIVEFAKNVKTNLKSNMDRFIVREYSIHSIRFYNLKSNMDRFIAFLLSVLDNIKI